MIRTGLIWSSILIVVMSAMAFYGMSVVPDGTEVAIHWNIAGEPDGYAGKIVAFWGVPAIALAITLFMAILPAIEPRKMNLAESSSLFIMGWVTAMLLLGMVQVVVLLSASGIYVPVVKVVTFVFGFVLILMGNILGKSQSNFVVGIKTPWTLSSDVAWDKTHRLAGRLWVLSGLALIVSGLVVPSAYAHYVPLTVLPLTMILPAIASYFYWRGDKSKKTEDA